MEVTKYYYFKLKNGIEYDIKVSLIKFNTNIMRNYKEMTNEQIEFYIENPNASVEEVVKCQLNPPYIPPQQDVQKYINMTIMTLKDVCRGYIDVTYFDYEMANATIQKTTHLLYYTGDTYYSLSEAKSIIKQFMDESVGVMAIYDKYKTLIQSATTIQNIDELYNNAVAELEEWKDNV